MNGQTIVCTNNGILFSNKKTQATNAMQPGGCMLKALCEEKKPDMSNCTVNDSIERNSRKCKTIVT